MQPSSSDYCDCVFCAWERVNHYTWMAVENVVSMIDFVVIATALITAIILRFRVSSFFKVIGITVAISLIVHFAIGLAKNGLPHRPVDAVFWIPAEGAFVVLTATLVAAIVYWVGKLMQRGKRPPRIN